MCGHVRDLITRSFKADIYVTISSIIWVPAEGIIDVFKELIGRGGAILDLIRTTG